MRLFLVLLFICAFQLVVTAQAQPESVETFLRREMRERRIPGLQVAVVRGGKIVMLGAYGIANIQNSVSVTNHGVFSINSCTKAFAGVAIMQLVEEGKLDLSAPVSHYLDGLPPEWQPVTIRQLLTHVSGLPNILQSQTSGKLVGEGGEDEAWAKVQTMPMEFPIGERFTYNQTNYVLLGKIIDKLTGTPFTQIFRERQFQVAGMPNSGFGDSRDVIPNQAQSYRYVRNLDGHALSDDKLTNVYEEFPPSRRTAAGIHSTAEEVARWIIALQQGKLLKTKTSLTTLWTPGAYNNGSPTQWALGWVTKHRAKHTAVIGTGGGRSAFFVYPDDDLAVVVLTNLAGAYPEEFIDELAGYYNPDIPAADPISLLRIQLRKRGFEHAIDVVNEAKKKDASFQASETDLNDWAYRMMSRGQKKEALEIFKLNVSLYPESANTFDSVAEAYEGIGNNELAIKNYKRSLELDPKNKNAVEHLRKLEPNGKSILPK
jgi:CubicO group peptidase (beta-lactamase class C family)